MRSQFPQERVAVSLLFLLNGYILGNWAPKIPFFLERMDITEAVMGGLIFIIGLGGLVILPVTGYWIAKAGSQVPSRLLALLCSFSLLLVTLASNIMLASAALFLLGACMVGMDIAINSNVALIEKTKKIKFMSSCHGCWSVGGIFGGFSGGALIQTLGLIGHAIIVTAVCVLILAYAWPRLCEYHEHKMNRSSFRLPRSPIIYLLGLISFLAVLPEGAIIDWSALYLLKELNASPTNAGYAFAAFSCAMALFRLSGDLLRSRFGSVNMIRVSCVFGALGMVIAGQADERLWAIIGFAISGIGIANMVPIAMSAAGKQADIPSGVGISTVAFISMTGIMSAPAVLGFVAEYVSFSVIFTALSIFFIIVFLLAPLTHDADN